MPTKFCTWNLTNNNIDEENSQFNIKWIPINPVQIIDKIIVSEIMYLSFKWIVFDTRVKNIADCKYITGGDLIYLMFSVLGNPENIS